MSRATARRWLAEAGRLLAGAGRLMAEAGRLMVGVPSYRAYVAHRAAAHPGEPVMSETAFFRNRQEARYAGRGGGKCC